jgi:spore cortex biosynthesis protein YabQ
MENTVAHELFILITSIAIGAMLGFVFDVFRLFKARRARMPLKSSLGDISFWVVSCFALLTFLGKTTGGLIRAYLILAIILGGVIYIKYFSPFVIKILETLLTAILKFGKTLAIILMFPFVLIWKILKPIYVFFNKIFIRKKADFRDSRARLSKFLKKI